MNWTEFAIGFVIGIPIGGILIAWRIVYLQQRWARNQKVFGEWPLKR